MHQPQNVSGLIGSGVTLAWRAVFHDLGLTEQKLRSPDRRSLPIVRDPREQRNAASY
jgi:hypothetical protein